MYVAIDMYSTSLPLSQFYSLKSIYLQRFIYFKKLVHTVVGWQVRNLQAGWQAGDPEKS